MINYDEGVVKEGELFLTDDDLTVDELEDIAIDVINEICIGKGYVHLCGCNGTKNYNVNVF